MDRSFPPSPIIAGASRYSPPPHGSSSEFVSKAFLYVGVFAASTVVAVFFRFIEERLGLLWRGWLTRRTVDRYLEKGVYHRLKERRELGNPDQRITDDIRSFTASTLSFVLMLLNATFTILAFSGVMWSISPLCSSWPSRTRRQRRGPRLLLSGSIVPVWFGSVASIQWRSSTKLGVVFHTPDREDYVVRGLSEIPVQPRQLPAGSPR